MNQLTETPRTPAKVNIRRFPCSRHIEIEFERDYAKHVITAELMQSAKQLAMHEYEEIGVTIRFEDLPIRMQHQFANICRKQMMILKGFDRSFILFPN